MLRIQQNSLGAIGAPFRFIVRRGDKESFYHSVAHSLVVVQVWSGQWQERGPGPQSLAAMLMDCRPLPDDDPAAPNAPLLPPPPPPLPILSIELGYLLSSGHSFTPGTEKTDSSVKDEIIEQGWTWNYVLGLLFTLTVSQVVDGGRQLCEVSVSEGLLGAHPLRRLRLQEHVGEVLGQRDLGQMAHMFCAPIDKNHL